MGARLASEPSTFKRNGTQSFKFPPKKSVIVDLRLDIAAFCLLRENSLQITVITFVNNIDSREICGLSLCPTSKLPQSCFQMFHPTLLLACQIFSVTSQK